MVRNKEYWVVRIVCAGGVTVGMLIIKGIGTAINTAVHVILGV